MTRKHQEDSKFIELCVDLNLDPASRDEAIREYHRIKENYTLEGDPIHWVACSLYVACRGKTVPTVENGELEGNCVSLTRLLRTANLSLIQFFNKIKKWADMASLPESFRKRIDGLERNFSVATVIFKKYKPIFVSVFKDPDTDPPKQPRSRKQRPKPCTASEVYDFIWRMFVMTKGNFPNISDDLVNSYHLLLCVVDWVYVNCVLGRRQDLLNAQFDVPSGPHTTSVPCTISYLCREHDGIEVEAKGIKEHYFKGYIRKLLERSVLKGSTVQDTLNGVLDINYFEDNCKAIDKTYEEYVLTIGDFDERIFLSKDADHEIGTPAKNPPPSANAGGSVDGPSLLLEAAARSSATTKLQEYMDHTRTLAPKTPLTGRHHLPPEAHPEPNVTPISTATQSVTKLHALLAGRKKDELSEALVKLFSKCSANPQVAVEDRVKTLSEQFCDAYTMPCNQMPASHADFAQLRVQCGSMLYYKILESIMTEENQKLEKRNPGKPVDLSMLLEQEVFHKSLFACCLEIILFSYNSQRTFPWVLAVYDLEPYDFYKVIELVIRAEEGFSRDVIKHLNSVEESILDCLAWKTDSPLWSQITILTTMNNEKIPKSEEVSINHTSSSINSNANGQGHMTVTAQHPLGSPLHSPITHPQVRRLAMSDGKLITKKTGDVTIYSPGHSPNRAPLATDRFSSPTSGTARRRLFPATSQAAGQSMVLAADGHSPALKQHIIISQQASTDDGKQIIIPFHIVQNVNQHNIITTTNTSPAAGSSATSTPSIMVTAPTSASSNSKATTSLIKPASNSSATGAKKRTGSLALFFRKVYHLASVRLKDLCDRLQADDQLRRRIWTTFEHCLVNDILLMKDRHLDQFLMCAVYSICKVSGHDRSFQDIMKCYRFQPQAQSHVYRSVLLNHISTSVPSSQSEHTNSQQSVTSDSSDRIQERLNNLRSSSTLPLSQGENAPPTPTRAAGSSSTVYENEERGDLIKFYNVVYVKHMKQFILRFQGREAGVVPSLSEMPLARAIPTSPRRISNQHPIYVSPHKKPTGGLGLITPNSRLLYCFNSSPAKDLRAINNMMRRDAKRPVTALAEKRPGSNDIGGPAIKHIKF